MVQQRADATTPAELAEAFEHDTNDGAKALCWKALARVVDESPTFVWQEGDSNGITVGCSILTGPFTGCEVRALVACPLGGGLEVRPLRKGQRILLDLLDGRVDGLIVASAGVPGGKEDPIPSVIAGVPLTSSTLEDKGQTAAGTADAPRSWLRAPPKGIGLRDYLRGGIAVTRLKGKQSDFFSGWVVSADDGAVVQMSWNGLTESYGFQIKDKQGAQLSVNDGIAALISPDGKTRIEVSNDGVLISSTGKVQQFGSPITINHKPTDGIPNPASGGVVVAKAGGAIVGVASISTSVFVGDAP
jgi:hypothetical protein